MILVSVFAPPPVAMLTAEGFGFLGAVVNEDGTVNHILSVLLGISLYLPPLTECRDCNRMVNRCEGIGRAILMLKESGDLRRYIHFAPDLRFYSYSINIFGLSTS